MQKKIEQHGGEFYVKSPNLNQQGAYQPIGIEQKDLHNYDLRKGKMSKRRKFTKLALLVSLLFVLTVFGKSSFVQADSSPPVESPPLIPVPIGEKLAPDSVVDDSDSDGVPPNAALYYSNPVWVRINYYSQHNTYGVYVIPTGHSNLKHYYMRNNTSGWSLGPTNQCRVSPVVGPGYLNDGGNSVWVPQGWIGMGICADTSTMLWLKAMGYNVYDISRWRLYFNW